MTVEEVRRIEGGVTVTAGGLVGARGGVTGKVLAFVGGVCACHAMMLALHFGVEVSLSDSEFWLMPRLWFIASISDWGHFSKGMVLQSGSAGVVEAGGRLVGEARAARAAKRLVSVAMESVGLELVRLVAVVGWSVERSMMESRQLLAC